MQIRKNILWEVKITTNLTNTYFISETFFFFFSFPSTCIFSPFPSFNDENINVQESQWRKSRLKSTINANSGPQTLTDDKIIKSQFNKNNVATIKSQ